MKRGNAIEVHNIRKSFKIYPDRGTSLKEILLFSKRRKYEIRNVINDISFEVREGEAIGLVGHNGCGKSTTLKMLTRIMFPDSGTIEMKGRVSSLIELGAGFHPEMTGRENIYINASIFGLNKKEIDARVDDIIAFSELEEFIDVPVRTYSSGMYMRLAFSVAINVDADILLIDEILAVGDAGFQAKCFNRLREIKASGVTIVIVSHSLGQIEQICERSLWIHEGVIKAEGKPREVHPMYMEYMMEERLTVADKEEERLRDKDNSIKVENGGNIDIRDNLLEAENDKGNTKHEVPSASDKRFGNGKAKIESIEIVHKKNNKPGKSFTTGETVAICLKYTASEPVKDASIGIGFFRADGLSCYGTNTRIDKVDTYNISGSGSVEVLIEHLQLITGHYSLDIAIEMGDGIPVDYWREAVEFDVYSPLEDVGVARIEHEWIISEDSDI